MNIRHSAEYSTKQKKKLIEGIKLLVILIVVGITLGGVAIYLDELFGFWGAVIPGAGAALCWLFAMFGFKSSIKSLLAILRNTNYLIKNGVWGEDSTIPEYYQKIISYSLFDGKFIIKYTVLDNENKISEREAVLEQIDILSDDMQILKEYLDEKILENVNEKSQKGNKDARNEPGVIIELLGSLFVLLLTVMVPILIIVLLVMFVKFLWYL